MGAPEAKPVLGARHARRQGRSDAVPAVPSPPSPLSALTRVRVSGAPQSPPCHRAFAHAIASASGVLTSNSPRSWFLTIRSLHTKVTCSERPSLRTGYHPQILTSLCTLFSLYSFFPYGWAGSWLLCPGFLQLRRAWLLFVVV